VGAAGCAETRMRENPDAGNRRMARRPRPRHGASATNVEAWPGEPAPPRTTWPRADGAASCVPPHPRTVTNRAFTSCVLMVLQFALCSGNLQSTRAAHPGRRQRIERARTDSARGAEHERTGAPGPDRHSPARFGYRGRRSTRTRLQRCPARERSGNVDEPPGTVRCGGGATRWLD
jgi:hypothetical protein